MWLLERRPCKGLEAGITGGVTKEEQGGQCGSSGVSNGERSMRGRGGKILKGLESCYYKNLSFSLREIGASEESF